MKSKKALILFLFISPLIVSCESSKNPYLYEDINLHYQSSDTAMETFLNDYTHRHYRYDEDAIGDNYIGSATGFAKNWDTMGIAWHNNRGNYYLEDRVSKIENYLTSITQDDLGMIYNTHNSKSSYFEEAGTTCHQGWPFPTWKNSAEYALDQGEYPGLNAMSFEFNGTPEEDRNWESCGGNFKIEAVDGYATFNTSNATQFSLYKTNIGKVLTLNKGINTKCAPFIEIDLTFNGTNVEDYYIIYKTKAGGNTWFKAPQKLYATSRIESFSSFNARQYIAMYLDENWNNQIVTDLGIEFVAKNGQTMQISNGIINYIRPNYDTRQSNATLQFLLALESLTTYTHNLTFIKNIMPKARRAMLFLLHALEGEKGLINVSYLYGHNGIGLEKVGDEYQIDCANGIANGWWDVSVNSELGLEPNIYFYQVLNIMASLEDIVSKYNLDIKEISTIRHKDLSSYHTVSYDYDSAYFKSLAKKVKAKIEEPIKVIKQNDGTYQNEGGFYLEETGRFVEGINEKTGKIHDYGNTSFNLQAIAAGIGNEEQQKSIMSWINGDRIVEGDISTGKDIYFYEFAPRCQTKECYEGFNFCAYTVWPYLQNGSDLYHLQVQAGGAVIMFSYYDLIARSKVLGSDNAYNRLQEIAQWYNKILNSKYHGTGTEFYNDYYVHLEEENSFKHPEEEGIYIVQNSSRDGAGAMGLDGEFLENVILCRGIKDAFFDGSYTDKVLNLSHNYNAKAYLQIDNCSYLNCTYSLYNDKNSISLRNLKGEIDKDQQISFTFATNKINPKVYLDGVLLKNSEYTFNNNEIKLITDFSNHTLMVK